MPSLRQRASARISRLRARRPLVDHAVRMQEHYGAVNAGQQAGGVTYFAFLSFFPIMALAFFVVGWISKVYSGAQHDLVHAINQVFPHLIGNGKNQISIADVQSAATTVGLIGLAGLLYAGLGWLSATRVALTVVFELPEQAQPNFVLGKLRDLLTLAIVGSVLFVGVAVTGYVRGFSGTVLGWLHLGSELGWLVAAVALVLGLAADALLFYSLFRLLAEPRVPTRSLWSGAALGALLFELLKQVSQLLLASTTSSPAVQVFGIALILVVWINYFSRVVLYAAAWAYTSPAARAARGREHAAPAQGPQTPDLSEVTGSGAALPGWVTPFVAGGVTALTAAAVLRKRLSKDDS